MINIFGLIPALKHRTMIDDSSMEDDLTLDLYLIIREGHRSSEPCATRAFLLLIARCFSAGRKFRFLPFFVLLLATLACTSNDTLFIQLTQTPIPTPTVSRPALQTRFAIGDKLTYVAATSPGALLNSADTKDKSTALCFTGTQVTINDAAVKDKTTFYKIKCAASDGWTPENTLTPIRANSNANLAQTSALTIDPEPDATTNRTGMCPANSTVSVLDLAISPLDGRIYANVQCAALTGWLPERSLK